MTEGKKKKKRKLSQLMNTMPKMSEFDLCTNCPGYEVLISQNPLVFSTMSSVE